MQHPNVMFDIKLFFIHSFRKLFTYAPQHNEDKNTTNATEHIVCSMKVTLPRRKVGTLNMSIVHGHVIVIRGDNDLDTSVCHNKTHPMSIHVSDLRGQVTVTVFGPAKKMHMKLAVVQQKVGEAQLDL